MGDPQTAPFWAWINERHAIYLRKCIVAGVEAPHCYDPDQWTRKSKHKSRAVLHEGKLTLDPVLSKYRFCNVFRELDTVTQWVDENIRRPYKDHPNLWLMLAIARTINWPQTLAFLIDGGVSPGGWPGFSNFSPEKLGAALDEYKSMGLKVYTGAYMIRAESNPKASWYNWTKQRYVGEIVIGRLWEDRENWQLLLEAQPTLQDVWRTFQAPQFIGWGPFMAYEVVTDLRHTRYLENAPDINTWANAGPGAKRGLNRLHGRPLKAPLSEEEALDMMRQLRSESINRFVDPTKGRMHHVPPMELRDIEHSLCEVDKWLRVRNGEGEPRSLYVPGRGY